MSLDRKDRSVVPRYWLEFETTEYNKLTGKVETHTQLEWMSIQHPAMFKKLR
mgnify:FL=1